MTIIVPPPGMFFTYKWKVNLFHIKQSFGLAQMLSIEPTGGIVHIRVFAFDESNPVAVGHLPIFASIVERDLKKRMEEHPVPMDSWKPINEWRAAKNSGFAGAFSVSIWEAVEMIRDTVINTEPNVSMESIYIDSGYPVKDSEGRFKTVEVVTYPLKYE